MPDIKEKLRFIINHPRTKQLSDVRNIGLYVFGLLTLVVSYNGLQVIQTNFVLQKKISVLRQQNEVQELKNSNLALRNTYLQTDQYLELTARRQLGKAAAGETLVLIPKEVSRKYAPPVEIKKVDISATENKEPEPFYKRNLKGWWHFFFRSSN